MGYTSYLSKYLKKAAAKNKDPLKTKESMTVLHNTEARRQEHDRLKMEQGFPEEQDPNAMRYQRYAEVETDEQGVIMHNKPPWIVNEASEMIAEINDDDAPSFKHSEKAANRAGKFTASVTKALGQSEGQNYGGVIAPERYAIVEKAGGEHDAEIAAGQRPGESDADWAARYKMLDRENVMSPQEASEEVQATQIPQKYSARQARQLGDSSPVARKIDAGDRTAGVRYGQAMTAAHQGGNLPTKTIDTETRERLGRAGLDYQRNMEKGRMGKLTKSLIKLYKARENKSIAPLAERVADKGIAEGRPLGERVAPSHSDSRRPPYEQIRGTPGYERTLYGRIGPPKNPRLAGGPPSGTETEKQRNVRQPAARTGMTSEQSGQMDVRASNMEKGGEEVPSETIDRIIDGEKVTVRNPAYEAYRANVGGNHPESGGTDTPIGMQQTKRSGKGGQQAPDKREQMIRNYIASLSKALVPPKNSSQLTGASLYGQETPQESVERQNAGIREAKAPPEVGEPVNGVPQDLSDLIDPETGKLKAGIDPQKIENFLPALGRAAAGALAGGGGDDDDMQMTEKGLDPTNKDLRHQQREYNRMSSGPRKKAGSMMGYGRSSVASKGRGRNRK